MSDDRWKKMAELMDKPDDELKESMRAYAELEVSVENALLNIDESADGHMVQAILITKIVAVAMVMGESKEDFLKYIGKIWEALELFDDIKPDSAETH